MKSRLSGKWILLLILILAGGLFATLLRAPSLSWDDDSNIFSNPFFRAGEWATFWQNPYFGIYVPVINWVWEIVYNLGHAAVWPFRVLNLSLHLTNIVLAYVLLSSLALRWRLTSVWPVLVGVALFAFHPLQVEAVSWISGGRDLLSATLALLCIYVYFKGTRWWNPALATIFFALALLSKPNSVVLPAVVFGLEVMLRPERWKRTAGWMGLWLALSVWPVILTMQAQAEHLPDIEVWARPWIVLDTYAFYAGKFVWPWRLSGNYAHTPDAVLAWLPSLWIGLSFAVVFFVAMLSAWRRDRRFLLAGLWVLLLLPVSGILPFGFQKISTTADHYHYLPMLAVAAIAMLTFERLSLRWRASTGIVTLTVLVLLFGVSCLRVGAWRSDKTFFADMAETAPKAYSTAIGLSIVSCLDEHDYDAGVHWTEVALEAQPGDILALANQAYCFLHAGNYFRVTELEFYLNNMDLEKMASQQPTAYSSFLASIGTAEVEMKEYEIGYQYLCEAYRVKPSEPNHARNLDVATDILKEQGLVPMCDPQFQVAPGDDDIMDDESPGDEGPFDEGPFGEGPADQSI